MPDDALQPELILASLGIHDATDVRPVSGGTATLIWRVERPGGLYALRVFRPGTEPNWRREVIAMATAQAAGLPVPALRAKGIWQDRPVMLLDWCPGTTLADALGHKPWLVWRLGCVFGRTQAAIHQVAPPADWAAEADEWIAAVGPSELELQQRLSEAPRLRPALLHLDYHPRNVMVDANRISGIIDWANARAGDPRADVARTFSILVVEPWQPGPQSLWLTIRRRILAMAWRYGYQSIAGPLGDLRLAYAWAGAVMLRDLAYRVDDPASWWQQRHLDQIRSWTTALKQSLGINTGK